MIIIINDWVVEYIVKEEEEKEVVVVVVEKEKVYMDFMSMVVSYYIRVDDFFMILNIGYKLVII